MPPTFRSASAPRTLGILGLPIHDVTLPGTLALFDSALAVRTPQFCVALEPAHLAALPTDPELLRTLCAAELVLAADPRIASAASGAGIQLLEALEAPTLLDTLIAHAAVHGLRTFAVGSSAEALARFCDNAALRHPGFAATATATLPSANPHAPESLPLVDSIREHRIDLLLIDLPIPEREKWIAMHHSGTGVPWTIGISLRLPGEPAPAAGWAERWNTRSLLRARASLQRKLCSAPQAARTSIEWEIRPDGSMLHLRAPDLIEGQLPQATLAAVQTRRAGDQILVDLSRLSALGTGGLGTLFTLAHTALRQAALLHITKPQQAVAQALKGLGLDPLFPLLDPSRTPATASSGEITARGFSVRSRPPLELTAATAGPFRQGVEERWAEATDALQLIVEMQGVRFMDSSGLGVLLALRRLTEQRQGARFIIEGITPAVQSVIRLAQLEEVFGLNQ